MPRKKYRRSHIRPNAQQPTMDLSAEQQLSFLYKFYCSLLNLNGNDSTAIDTVTNPLNRYTAMVSRANREKAVGYMLKDESFYETKWAKQHLKKWIKYNNQQGEISIEVLFKENFKPFDSAASKFLAELAKKNNSSTLSLKNKIKAFQAYGQLLALEHRSLRVDKKAMASYAQELSTLLTKLNAMPMFLYVLKVPNNLLTFFSEEKQTKILPEKSEALRQQLEKLIARMDAESKENVLNQFKTFGKIELSIEDMTLQLLLELSRTNPSDFLKEGAPRWFAGYKEASFDRLAMCCLSIGAINRSMAREENHSLDLLAEYSRYINEIAIFFRDAAQFETFVQTCVLKINEVAVEFRDARKLRRVMVRELVSGSPMALKNILALADKGDITNNVRVATQELILILKRINEEQSIATKAIEEMLQRIKSIISKKDKLTIPITNKTGAKTKVPEPSLYFDPEIAKALMASESLNETKDKPVKKKQPKPFQRKPNFFPETVGHAYEKNREKGEIGVITQEEPLDQISILIGQQQYEPAKNLCLEKMTDADSALSVKLLSLYIDCQYGLARLMIKDARRADRSFVEQYELNQKLIALYEGVVAKLAERRCLFADLHDKNKALLNQVSIGIHLIIESLMQTKREFMTLIQNEYQKIMTAEQEKRLKQYVRGWNLIITPNWEEIDHYYENKFSECDGFNQTIRNFCQAFDIPIQLTKLIEYLQGLNVKPDAFVSDEIKSCIQALGEFLWKNNIVYGKSDDIHPPKVDTDTLASRQFFSDPDKHPANLLRQLNWQVHNVLMPLNEIQQLLQPYKADQNETTFCY